MAIVRAASLAQRIVALSLAVLLSGCSSAAPTAPILDPAGTVTSALRIQGQGAFLIDFDLGTVMTTNTGGVADLFLDANVNFNVGPFVPAGQQPRRVADVGVVSGLGAVTAIPTAGYVTTLSALVGHGYVLEDNGRRWRVYVVNWITAATTGGVIGVTIKWAAL
jgi:hypothetical protein